MEFSFEVGQTETHSVRFTYSRLVNTVRIDIDGTMVKRDKFWMWIPAERHYEFEVGANEHHKVAIDTSIPRIGAKFANPKCQVTVDGRVIGTY